MRHVVAVALDAAMHNVLWFIESMPAVKLEVATRTGSDTTLVEDRADGSVRPDAGPRTGGSPGSAGTGTPDVRYCLQARPSMTDPLERLATVPSAREDETAAQAFEQAVTDLAGNPGSHDPRCAPSDPR